MPQRWQALLAALCLIWLTWDSNLRPPVPEMNALPLDSLVDFLTSRKDELAYQGFNDIVCWFYLRRWSSRGRPRGHILKSLALASKPQVLENCPVLGSRTALFSEQLKFRWKTPETSRKICEHLFVFLSWSIGVGKGRGCSPPQLKFHQWQKCDKKAYCFLSFFYLAFFADNSITN